MLSLYWKSHPPFNRKMNYATTFYNQISYTLFSPFLFQFLSSSLFEKSKFHVVFFSLYIFSSSCFSPLNIFFFMFDDIQFGTPQSSSLSTLSDVGWRENSRDADEHCGENFRPFIPEGRYYQLSPIRTRTESKLGGTFQTNGKSHGIIHGKVNIHLKNVKLPTCLSAQSTFQNYKQIALNKSMSFRDRVQLPFLINAYTTRSMVPIGFSISYKSILQVEKKNHLGSKFSLLANLRPDNSL